jgi:hypothetical protein
MLRCAALGPQENVKTKHPQLHYESKLYMLLQGGSKSIVIEQPIYFVVTCYGYGQLS